MNFDVKEIFTAGMVLFAVIDIIGSIPIVISLRAKVGHIQSEKASIVSAIIMIAFLFVNILLQKAQSTINFPTQKATWQEGYYLSVNQIIPERRVLCGDTTINSKIYSKIFSIFLKPFL